MQYLYRAYGPQNQLLYVGISSEWHKRLHTHERNSEWIEQADWVKLERFDTRKEVAAAERYAIETEAPLYNKTFSQSYAHPIQHWSAVKRWIKSGQADDDFHQNVVDNIRSDALIYEKKICDLRSAGIAFLYLDWLRCLHRYDVLDCRNCQGVVSANMLQGHEELGEAQLLEGLE